MPTRPTQELQQLIAQLSGLTVRVRTGLAADDIARELECAVESLKEMTTHDELTGALNRRGLLLRLKAELARAKRTGHPFSFATFAVDQFDAVCLQFGRAAADRILCGVAQSLIASLRSLDAVGRTGDNEFAIILPTTWLDQSDKAMARLAKAVAAADLGRATPGLPITFSAGVTSNFPGDAATDMMQRAADALQQALLRGGGVCVQQEQLLPEIDPENL